MSREKIGISVDVTGIPLSKAGTDYCDKISWLDLYIFNASDGSIEWFLEKQTNISETFSFALISGDEYICVAVANSSKKFTSLQDYESSLYELSDIKDTGLVMSGKKEFTALEDQQIVTVTLKRLITRLRIEKLSVKLNNDGRDIPWKVETTLRLSGFPYRFPFCARIDDDSCKAFDVNTIAGREFYENYINSLDTFQKNFLVESGEIVGSGSTTKDANIVFYRFPQHHDEAQRVMYVIFSAGGGDEFVFSLTLPYMEVNTDYCITEMKIDSTGDYPIIKYTAAAFPWVSDENVFDIE